MDRRRQNWEASGDRDKELEGWKCLPECPGYRVLACAEMGKIGRSRFKEFSLGGQRQMPLRYAGGTEKADGGKWSASDQGWPFRCPYRCLYTSSQWGWGWGGGGSHPL